MTLQLTNEQIKTISDDLIEQYGKDDLLPVGEFVSFLRKYTYTKVKKTVTQEPVNTFKLSDVIGMTEDVALGALDRAGYKSRVIRRNGNPLPQADIPSGKGFIDLVIYKDQVSIYYNEGYV
jgi:hypothetical protein